MACRGTGESPADIFFRETRQKGSCISDSDNHCDDARSQKHKREQTLQSILTSFADSELFTNCIEGNNQPNAEVRGHYAIDALKAPRSAAKKHPANASMRTIMPGPQGHHHSKALNRN
jgi:hypothetical protein